MRKNNRGNNKAKYLFIDLNVTVWFPKGRDNGRGKKYVKKGKERGEQQDLARDLDLQAKWWSEKR